MDSCPPPQTSAEWGRESTSLVSIWLTNLRGRKKRLLKFESLNRILICQISFLFHYVSLISWVHWFYWFILFGCWLFGLYKGTCAHSEIRVERLAGSTLLPKSQDHFFNNSKARKSLNWSKYVCIYIYIYQYYRCKKFQDSKINPTLKLLYSNPPKVTQIFKWDPGSLPSADTLLHAFSGVKDHFLGISSNNGGEWE